VVAQGGVTPASAGELVRNGAAGVAVTGAILQAADPAEAARELRQALDAAREG
jgi:thiamine monophosphate synthase